MESQVTEPYEHGSMPCIACNADCEFLSPPEESVWPMVDGTQFEATGNYGSTAYDPIGGENSCLQVTVCNDCIRNYQHRIHFLRWDSGGDSGYKKLQSRETFDAPPHVDEEAEEAKSQSVFKKIKAGLEEAIEWEQRDIG